MSRGERWRGGGGYGGQESGDPRAGLTLGGRYLPNRAVGEGLYLVALLPLAVLAYNRVEEVRRPAARGRRRAAGFRLGRVFGVGCHALCRL